MVLCQFGKVPGISYDGGYAEYVLAPANTLAAVPKELTDADAAPLMCAGITTFNALRNSRARPGDLVAVLGLGGLGHLGVQYAAKLGCNTVAIARGTNKEGLARELGARHYIDSQSQNVAASLMALGGAKVILATATSGAAMSDALGGLARNGKLVILGAADTPIQVPATTLIMKRASVVGWPSGVAADSEETLAFSALSGVRPSIEKYPLERASEAFERMLSGKARFRVVLTMGA
jgi:D-arabinose 1-dehydrogenase-like Zn-dependent alcohol dehydrogenase